MAFTTPTRSHGDQCIERACVSVTFHGAGSVIVLAHAASGSAPARRMPSSHSHSAVVSDIARRFIHRSLPRSGDGAVVVVVVVVVVATIEVPGSAASAASDAVSASAFAFAAAASLSASATLPFNRASSRATAADDAVSPLAAAPGASGSFCTSERRGGVQRRQAWS